MYVCNSPQSMPEKRLPFCGISFLSVPLYSVLRNILPICLEESKFFISDLAIGLGIVVSQACMRI